MDNNYTLSPADRNFRDEMIIEANTFQVRQEELNGRLLQVKSDLKALVEEVMKKLESGMSEDDPYLLQLGDKIAVLFEKQEQLKALIG